MKYLLIDGNNLACRVAFPHAGLKNNAGESSGVHFGFFSSLLQLKKRFPEHQFFISWDGKSKRRMLESEQAVKAGIIPSAYKENRLKGPVPQEIQDFKEQKPLLKVALDIAGIPQIELSDYETDDIINSYCLQLPKTDEIVCVTGDEDYYQLLSDNVSIWNDGKKTMHTMESWTKETGLIPEQHVHVGALSGDSGDNIHGVRGVGPKTAADLIKEHGTYQNVLKAFRVKLDDYRAQYKDLEGEEFQKLAKLEMPSKKPKYPEITQSTKYTGVALALEEKKITGVSKTEVMTLMFEERVHLAYSLKLMDVVKDLPAIKPEKCDKEGLLEYFQHFDIHTLQEDAVDMFC